MSLLEQHTHTHTHTDRLWFTKVSWSKESVTLYYIAHVSACSSSTKVLTSPSRTSSESDMSTGWKRGASLIGWNFNSSRSCPLEIKDTQWRLAIILTNTWVKTNGKVCIYFKRLWLVDAHQEAYLPLRCCWSEPLWSCYCYQYDC